MASGMHGHQCAQVRIQIRDQARHLIVRVGGTTRTIDDGFQDAWEKHHLRSQVIFRVMESRFITAPINHDTPSTATSHSTSLDDPEPRPLITRTELNQALEVVQLYIIQTAPPRATPQDTASLMDSITTLDVAVEYLAQAALRCGLERCKGLEV